MTYRTVSDAGPSRQAKPCAVCGKPQVEAFRPFCSRRCADVDLHRWLSGAYALPALEDDDADDGWAGRDERAGGRQGHDDYGHDD